MAMKPNCIAAVRQAAAGVGRGGITDAEIAAVGDRLQRTMRRLAYSEAGWQGLSTDMRVSLAAERAIADIRGEAAQKVANAQRQVVATAGTEARIAQALRAYEGSQRAEALVHDMDESHRTVAAIKAESMAHLMDLIDAAKSGQGAGPARRAAMFLFDVDNPQMTRDFAAEVFASADGHTGNHVAQLGARAWLQTIEELRARFNNAGGDVGKLDYGYLPQPHDAARVRAAGADKWAADMLGRLDRSRYLDEAGARLPDADVLAMLRSAWETIGTEGLNKQEPGAFKGSGARANGGSHSRELHFKDAEAFNSYLAEYGRASMYEAMMSHVGGMARNIALVERYGPNPNAQMRLQFDLAARADGTQTDTLARSMGLRPQSYWDVLNGTAATPQSARLAELGSTVRNMQVAGKLAGAVVSSVTDLATYFVSTGYNKLGYWNALANIGRTAASADMRAFLTTHGIIAESMAGDLNRWSSENLSAGWSGRVAASVMKLSLMNAWTDTLRRAFSLTMMQGLARMSRTEWGKLTEWDRTHLERKGITEADWRVVARAELTEFKGLQHLTPESIRDTGHARSNEVVAKVLGLIQDESEYAVLNPDLATKAISSGGGTRSGTVRGELARSVMQFKSFPVAMISRHWRRMLDAPKVTDGSAPVLANRLMHSGALLVSTTALGAIALQAKQMIAGKDPIDMQGEHAFRFWMQAIAQGGGLSIVGDMLLTDPGTQPGDFVKAAGKTALGPAIGTAAEAAAIASVNTWNAAKGKPTHAAAEALQLARGNTPFVNLWYAKAAIDHAGMHALQENLSPGYLGKMQQRAQQQWGQSYWWKPGTGGPDRAPNMAKAAGQ